MERDELIKRAPNPDDGRSSLFSLTPRAQSKVRAVRDILVKGSAEMFDGFSAGQITMLASLLQQAIENLEAAASR
jgi:MarR family transcriptional regulator for hemolysin